MTSAANGVEDRRFWIRLIVGLCIHLATVLVALTLAYAGIDKRLAIIESRDHTYATREYVDGLVKTSEVERAGLRATDSAILERVRSLEEWEYDQSIDGVGRRKTSRGVAP